MEPMFLAFTETSLLAVSFLGAIQLIALVGIVIFKARLPGLKRREIK